MVGKSAFGAFALIFLVNTIVNPTLARFFHQRQLWQVREGPARTYGWVALCNASLLAEMPAIAVTGAVYFLLWYFLTGLPLGQPASYTFLMVMVYEVFKMSFGLVVAALSPDLEFAGLVLVFLVTIFNWFNGVVVPYRQIQGFWRYWVSCSLCPFSRFPVSKSAPYSVPGPKSEFPVLNVQRLLTCA